MTQTTAERLSGVLKSQPAIVGTVALGASAMAAIPASAIVVETELGLIIADGTDGHIDVNNDGLNDIKIFAGKSFGEIHGKATKSEMGFTSTKIFKDGGFARAFQPGDTVDKLSGPTTTFTKLYDGPNGPWADSGDTAYVGFSFYEELFDIEEPDEDDFREGNVYYGWLELTRGSIIAGTLGLQNQPRIGAPIPGTTNPVPIPPGIALLATGAAGLAAMRRRKKAA